MIGYQNPNLGYVLWVISALLLLLAAWPWLKRWRPLTFAPEQGALASGTNKPALPPADPEEVTQLRTKLREVEQELAEAHQTIRSQRRAMEDEHGVVDWGEHEGRTLGALSPANAKELEGLRAENERLKNQAAPRPLSELKPLCLHLAEELEWEDTVYKDGEHAIQIWIPELKEQGLSQSEIDKKVDDARYDNARRAINRYNKRHKDRLLNLYDALGSREWFSPSDRRGFANLKDPYHFINVARRLREVCGKFTADIDEHSKRPGDEEIEQRCQGLSQKLKGFLENRAEVNPHISNLYEERRLESEGASQKGIQAHQRKAGIDQNHFYQQTVEGYKNRFEDDVLALADVLVGRGWLDEAELQKWEKPNAVTIEEIAQTLGRIGSQL